MTPSTRTSEQVLAEMREAFECWNTGGLVIRNQMFADEQAALAAAAGA